MRGRYYAGVLLAFILVIPATSAFFSLPSPWGYICDSKKGTCIKEERSGVCLHTTLAQCKLTCGQYGVLWPKPNTATIGKDVVKFLPSSVKNMITAYPEVLELLDQAVNVFKDNIEKNHPEYSDGVPLWDSSYVPDTAAHIVKLQITVSEIDCRLALNTDESYSLIVKTVAGQSTVTINAQTFFGARHALETLSQLIDYDENTDALMLVSDATITDSPAFPYRGILLDTSRNFFCVNTIKRTIDAMAANKLNTFHWHITDSHSFPLYLEGLPKMAYYGAYSSKQIYYPADVRDIVEYGKIRGIRVLPEFDAPAHVGNGFQWGPHNGLGNLAVCVNREPWQSYCAEPPCGQLNLANPKMYDVLGKIYNEMVDLFGPIDLFHYGGDGVNLNCWNTTDEITSWMTQHGHGLDADAYYRQLSVFHDKAHQLLTSANNQVKVPGILRNSPLTEAGRADQYLSNKDYIIQISTTGDDPLIGELLDKNFRVIFSNHDRLFLDCGFGAWVGEGNNWCSPYKGWQAVYDNSPIAIATNLTSSFNRELILGGEAAMWSEQVDDTSVDSRIWPRGAALGERLWANPDHNWEPAEIRFIHQRQRMVQRGIQADRIQPQWCHQNEGLCYI